MRASVAKWGNSLAVRLPKDAVEAIGLRDGSPLDLTIQDGALTLRPRQWDIKALVAQIEGDPPPLEFENTARGSEVW
ncbi:AbrB/MazE/SpoVT family DNA-binding domain-containing protein [Caulobacter sp. DWP3-1-3b2]|uniref:AbrB/MazE/SpoVT family DNA-binding domain-containing protein n=1 Tax=unclassified Caulobacter TaxID=2648921 RepID=UPI003CE69143